MSFPNYYTIVLTEEIDENVLCYLCKKLLIYPVLDTIVNGIVCSCCVIDRNSCVAIEHAKVTQIEAVCSKTTILCLICKQNFLFSQLCDHISNDHKSINLKVPEIIFQSDAGSVVIAETSNASLDIGIDDTLYDDPEMLRAINDVYLLVEEKRDIVEHSNLWFGHDVYVNPKLELNSIGNVLFNEDNIPILLKEKEEKRKSKKTETSIPAFVNRKEYHGALKQEVIRNEDGSASVGYTLEIYPDRIFIFPTTFDMYDQYVYSFFADEMRRSFNDKEGWKVIYNKNHPLRSHPIEWSRHAWSIIVRDLFREPPLKYFIDQRDELTALPNEAFPDQFVDGQRTAMSFIYMYYIRKHIHPKMLEMMERMKDFKLFFFGDEIEELCSTWFPSRESLIALNVDCLFILFNMFSKEGISLIKYYYFKYLFFRPDEDTVIMNGLDVPFSQSLKFLEEHGEKINVIDLFTCSNTAQTCVWPLPTFPCILKESIASYVFITFKRGIPDTGILYEAGIMYEFESKLKKTDTCVYMSELSAAVVDWKKSPGFNLDRVIQNLRRYNVIEIFDSEQNKDRCIVTRYSYFRAQMLLIALQTMFSNYIQFREDPLYQFQTEMMIHPFADAKYVAKQTTVEWSGEQELAMHIHMTKPISFIGGEAGTGKTETMRGICNMYHKHEVIYTSAVATTVIDVGFKKVCRRSLTLHRLLIIHSMYCLNNANAQQFRDVLFRANQNRRTNEDDDRLTPDKQIFFKDKYFCKPMFNCYSICPCEKFRLLIIDEAGITDIVNICRVLYIMSRCAAKNIKVLIGGDGGQLLSIAAGDSYQDILRILYPFSVVYKIDHRTIGNDSIPRISNNRAVRAGEFKNIYFGMKTMLEHSQSTRYKPDPLPVANVRGYHFIEIAKVLGNNNKPEDIENALKPTLEYLLSKKEYLGHIKQYGVSDYLRICCPTHAYKEAISNWIKNNIFKERARQTGRCFEADELITVYGEKEEIFKGMKIIYTMNRYKHGLYNNLPYIVHKIQDVVFSKNGEQQEAQQKAAGSSSDYDISDLVDDMVTIDGDVTAQPPPGGQALSVKKSSEEIDREFAKYSFDESTVIVGHEDLPSTNAKTPLGFKARSYGRRLVIVPIADVDRNGRVMTTANQVIIPWTNNNWFLVKSASAGTIFGNQGGQCVGMIIVMPIFYKERDTNNLLYVGVSRSTEFTVIVSKMEIIEQVVENFAPERKTHYADYVCPNIKHFYDNPLMQIDDVPLRIQAKLNNDQAKLDRLDSQIDAFRKKMKKERKQQKKEPEKTFSSLAIAGSSSSSGLESVADFSNSFFLSYRVKKRPSRTEDMDCAEPGSGDYIPISKKQATNIPQQPPKASLPVFKKCSSKPRINRN
jgi:hypothetical protein